jgi:hypothetical protein
MIAVGVCHGLETRQFRNREWILQTAISIRKKSAKEIKQN